MEHDLSTELDRRLRAARPTTARIDDDAFDAELLARVRRGPIASRRPVPRAVAWPVAAGLAVTTTAVVLLAGGPGDVGGPSSASAVAAQTLHWLTPAPGTILHVRSVESQGGSTTTSEFWQSGDDPTTERLQVEGQLETAGDAFYDPATDTIYDPPTGATPGKEGKPGDPLTPPGDPAVAKVRVLLQRGDMTVTGPETHDGVEAWVVSLKADFGRPVWRLWVSAADGRPLELRDPGRDATEAPQVIRWPTYEVTSNADADAVLTLTGAHPSARVVDDPAQVDAAQQRLRPDKP